MALTRGGYMIRLADEADADAISKLNEELFIVLNELKGDIYNPVAFPKYFIDSMIKSHESDYILIEDDNKVVGYALIEQRESPYTEYSAFVEDHFAYIYELVVLPEYRDKGYGKQIVKEAKEEDIIKEGEGNLETWRKVHIEFFKKYYPDFNDDFDILFEEFEVVGIYE